MSANGSPISRIMIVGASGYLGSAIAMSLRDQYEVFGTYSSHPIRIEGVTCVKLNGIEGGDIVDVTKKVRPDAIVYCSAINSAEICEQDVSLAESVNFKMASIFFKVISPSPYLFYFSCDQVFGKPSEAPFKEEDAISPLNAFSKSKSSGEVSVLGQKFRTAVLRIPRVFGEPFGPSNALRNSWLDPFLRELEKGRAVAPSRIRIHNHIYLGDAVRALGLIIAKPPEKAELYHLGTKDAMSNFDFLKKYCEIFGLDPALVTATDTNEPRKYSMNCSKFAAHYKFTFPTVAESLQEYADRMRTGFTKNWI